MRQTIRHYAKLGLIKALRFLRGNFDQFNSLSQQMQVSLRLSYAELARRSPDALPRLQDVGFRVYSQFEEDGQILFILSVIGFKTRRVVEICAADGMECLATNLIMNHGFEAYLFDGDPRNVERGRVLFENSRDTLLVKPVFTQAWITAENVNQLLSNAGAQGEVDVLSIDIDGNDYWVWQAIDVISPRLCVLETQNIVPSDKSLTIRYDPGFSCWSKSGVAQNYRGMSLKAAISLARRKGYRLIGAHRHGFNVYFLRNDIAPELFPEVSIESVHDNTWTRECQTKTWPLVADMDWVEVAE